MAYQLVQATVVDEFRKAIHVIRVVDEILAWDQINEVTEKMRERMLSRHGEQFANVVFVQGDSKETLRLYGDFHAVTRVRTAMFNAAISWRPIEL